MSDGDPQPSRATARTLPLHDPDDPVACPECRQWVAPRDLDDHLRRAHHLYPVDGRRLPAPAAVDALLPAVAAAPPDAAAWRALAALAREDRGPQAEPFLAAALGGALAGLPAGDRPRVTDAVAALLASHGGTGLAAALAADPAPEARQLALATAGRLTPPLDPGLFDRLLPLLPDRHLPAEAQVAAAAALLRSLAPDDPRAAGVLEALCGSFSKRRAIERLGQVERRAGKHPAVDALAARLEDRLRMGCPRCDAQLRRPDMVRHLWEEHRLVLDARRVRDPWAVIDDWVAAYRHHPDPVLLERARALADRFDPDGGLPRLFRLLLSRGVPDPDALAALREEAGERHASLCPACYAAVPVPREVPPSALARRHGRLTADGYVVEAAERGLLTRLEVRTPDRLVYRGREPGRRWTPSGAQTFLAGPPVLAALVCSLALPGGPAAVAAVAGLLGLALAAHAAARYVWQVHVPAAERLRNYAWTLLVPHLHEKGFSAADSAYAAGLARASTGDRHAALRRPHLPRLVDATEEAVKGGHAPPGHLAALLRLAVSDAARAGEDPVPRVADELARCFEGGLPLAVAEGLLAGWEADWWTGGNLARLRVLLCDRAFEAGFEVQNLLDAGRNSPALAELLGTDNPHHLAALRLLWSLRATRPWDRFGAAVTAFDLAADPDHARLLARHPDLLLRREEPGWEIVADGGRGKMGPAEILVDSRGLTVQEVSFAAPPRIVELRQKSVGYELQLNHDTFRSPDPLDGLARLLERWFRYAFLELLPEVAAVLGWKPPDRTALWRAWGAVPCPDCGRHFLPRPCEVGTALDAG